MSATPLDALATCGDALGKALAAGIDALGKAIVAAVRARARAEREWRDDWADWMATDEIADARRYDKAREAI